jgi:hypothetical protein
MNRKEGLKIVEEAHARRLSLWARKNQDYANENTLANFQVLAQLHATFAYFGMPIDMSTSKGQAMHYQLIKFCRRLNLYKQGVTPQNESIMDTIDDAGNYLDLEMLCFLEEAEELRKLETQITTSSLEPLVVKWQDQCQRTNCFELATVHCSCGMRFCYEHGKHECRKKPKFTVCPKCGHNTIVLIDEVENSGCYHQCTNCLWDDLGV